jgi:Uma2 family endonuclease
MATAHNLTDDGLPKGLTVNEFLVWHKDRPGRYELHNGNVVAMSPERLGHVEIKSNVHQALRNAIKIAGLPCFAVADGIAVHVSETKWYQPDALVYCGERADRSVTKIDNPMIVVEVASPSTASIDTQDKLLGYLALPSGHHYLIIDPDGLPLLHHHRQSTDTFLTRIVGGGTLKLDPPGIEIDVTELFD